MFSLLLTDFISDFYLTSLQLVLCSVAAVKRLPVQACMPRGIIAPLQIGLGVQMHHLYGSKFLIETLNSLGFCSSYTEIQKFETSAASCQGTSFDLSNGQVVQYVADNVDHIIGTLDGRNTFHGMDIIASVTPKFATCTSKSVPRVKASTEDLVAIGKVNIHFYRQSGNRMEELKYRKLMDLSNIEDTSEEFEFLLKISQDHWNLSYQVGRVLCKWFKMEITQDSHPWCFCLC